MTPSNPLIAEIRQHALIPIDRTTALKPHDKLRLRSPVGEWTESHPTGL